MKYQAVGLMEKSKEMNKIKAPKSGVLLFEVAFVVMIVSIMSVFLFRGYATFTKVARKSLDYIKLVLVSDAKIWDLELEEYNAAVTKDMHKEGDFDTGFRWRIILGDTDHVNFKRTRLTIDSTNRAESFDRMLYLKSEDE